MKKLNFKKFIAELLINLIWCLPLAFCVQMLLESFGVERKISIIIALCFYMYDIMNTIKYSTLEDRIEELKNKIDKK